VSLRPTETTGLILKNGSFMSTKSLSEKKWPSPNAGRSGLAFHPSHGIFC
jgi:hypothetical protein